MTTGSSVPGLALPVLDAALADRLRARLTEVEAALARHVRSEAEFVTSAASHLMAAGGKRFRLRHPGELGLLQGPVFNAELLRFGNWLVT